MWRRIGRLPTTATILRLAEKCPTRFATARGVATPPHLCWLPEGLGRAGRYLFPHFIPKLTPGDTEQSQEGGEGNT